jgi:hypothetical protein
MIRSYTLNASRDNAGVSAGIGIHGSGLISNRETERDTPQNRRVFANLRTNGNAPN